MTSFSSQGLAFDGSMKPDVVAPGVALETAEPGTAPDGSALYGTVNGTSGAAAIVAGAAAQLAQMRPSLDATALRSLLAGYAQQGRASPFASAAARCGSAPRPSARWPPCPATLGFGIWQGTHWHATRTGSPFATSRRGVCSFRSA